MSEHEGREIRRQKFQQLFTANVSFKYEIKHFTSCGAVFSDDSEEYFEYVIYATGECIVINAY